MKKASPAKEAKNPTGETLEMALTFVGQQLDAMEPFIDANPFGDEWIRWWRATTSGIKQHFGDGSDEYRWATPNYYPVVIIGEESPQRRDAREREDYSKRVRDMRNALQSILDKYAALGPSAYAPGPQQRPVAVPRAFISHGDRKPSLTKIQEFLRALGIEPIVVEGRAGESRELHDNVDHYRGLSDFAIVLWTKDLQEANESWHPSGSVAVESGELRMQFKGRVIYLREEGVTLPAMSGTIVYETFTEGNMGPAFQKIVTELRGWGWLNVIPLH